MTHYNYSPNEIACVFLYRRLTTREYTEIKYSTDVFPHDASALREIIFFAGKNK